MDLTSAALSVTSISVVAFKSGALFGITVIIALPAFTGVTMPSPSSSTVTAVSGLVGSSGFMAYHLTVLSVASSGLTSAVNLTGSSVTSTLTFCSFITTPVGLTLF